MSMLIFLTGTYTLPLCDDPVHRLLAKENARLRRELGYLRLDRDRFRAEYVRVKNELDRRDDDGTGKKRGRRG